MIVIRQNKKMNDVLEHNMRVLERTDTFFIVTIIIGILIFVISKDEFNIYWLLCCILVTSCIVIRIILHVIMRWKQ